MKLLNLLLCLALPQLACAQFQGYEFAIGYTFAAPIATMKQNVEHGNGITMEFNLIPENSTRLVYGMDINYTIYGHDKSRQEYTFNDGSTAKMDIIVNNSFMNFMVGGRYFIVEPEGK